MLRLLLADGPRWLISKDRLDDSVLALERVRPKADVAAGLCRSEAIAIQEALNNNIGKGPWLDLFVRCPDYPQDYI